MRKMLYDLSQIYTLLFEAKITLLKQIDKEVNKFKEDDKKNQEGYWWSFSAAAAGATAKIVENLEETSAEDGKA